MWRILGPVLNALAGVIKEILPYVVAYKAAKNAGERDRAENVAKIKDKQMRIASRARPTRADILERMRDNQL